MLKKLDRYIIGKFLRTFFFTVLIFSLVGVIVHFSEKVEDFIESEITASEIIFGYFPAFILHIMGYLWPMLCLISVIFFTGRLANNSEILSILNAGVSFRRLLRPFLITTGFLTVLYLIGLNYAIPWGNEARIGYEQAYFGHHRDKGQTANVHYFVAPNTKVFMTHYSKRDSTARNFRLEYFEDSELKKLTKARGAKYLPANPGKGRDEPVWRLTNYESRTFDGTDETLEVHPYGHVDTVLNLHPVDFVEFTDQQTSMNTLELIAYIRKQRARGAGNFRAFEVELARRTAEPFTLFILTLIGVSVAGRKTRGGMGVQLALGMLIGALFVFLSRFASTISASADLPIYFGMWLPNIVFSFAAVYFVAKAQR